MEYNKENIKQMFIYFINKDELLEVKPSYFDIDFIDDIAKNIINANIYSKTADTSKCKYCPMKYYCDRY